jgi:hypothetical protein
MDSVDSEAGVTIDSTSGSSKFADEPECVVGFSAKRMTVDAKRKAEILEDVV